MALDNAAALQELPDLVINEILCRLPTKVAVNISLLSKQWVDVLSNSLALEFDECGDNYKQNNLQKHKTSFIDVLKKTLLICENQKQERELNKFGLRMMNYLSRDAFIVSKWLGYSLLRSVKEIDISLKSQPWWDIRKSYNLSMMTFVNASRSLTSLNLEYVTLRSTTPRQHIHIADAPLFPFLKKMSFKNVTFNNLALYHMLQETPIVESLSMISCSFGYYLTVTSSSVKFLVIEDCDARAVAIRPSFRTFRPISNLEFAKVVSNKDLQRLDLSKCHNLKHINVHGNRGLKYFLIDGCNDLKGTINTPVLDYFSYEGYLNSRLSFRAPHLRVAIIILLDNWSREASFDSYEHFTKLKDFLKEFGTSKQVSLHVNDFKSLIFPEDFIRSLTTSILPNAQTVGYVATEVRATRRDEERLFETLRWMAPLARRVYRLKYIEKWGMYEDPD